MFWVFFADVYISVCYPEEGLTKISTESTITTSEVNYIFIVSLGYLENLPILECFVVPVLSD